MISYERPRLWQQPWFLVVTVGVLSGVGVWWWSAGNESGQPTSPPVMNSVVRGDLALSEPAVSPLAAPSTLADGRPSDFTMEEWATLKDAVKQADNPQAELARVRDYLRFQKGFGQWQTLQASPDTARRHQLAQQLLDQLPERLRQGEMNAGEFAIVQQALLLDLVPDEAQRKQRIAQLQASLAAVTPQGDTDQQRHEAAALAEYKRREAAIVADYQTRPEAQRNPGQLEEALEAARRAVYDRKN